MLRSLVGSEMCIRDRYTTTLLSIIRSHPRSGIEYTVIPRCSLHHDRTRTRTGLEEDGARETVPCGCRLRSTSIGCVPGPVRWASGRIHHHSFIVVVVVVLFSGPKNNVSLIAGVGGGDGVRCPGDLGRHRRIRLGVCTYDWTRNNTSYDTQISATFADLSLLYTITVT